MSDDTDQAILCGRGQPTDQDRAAVAAFATFLRARSAVTDELVERVAATRHQLTNQGYLAAPPPDPTPWDRLDPEQRARARQDTKALLLAAHVAGVWHPTEPAAAGH